MISSIETSPRARFPVSVASSDLERRSLATQLIVAGVEVRDQDRQVLRRQLGQARAQRLRAQLDDDQHAEDEGDDRDRDLAPRAMHRQPPGTGGADDDGAADGIGRE